MAGMVGLPASGWKREQTEGQETEPSWKSLGPLHSLSWPLKTPGLKLPRPPEKAPPVKNQMFKVEDETNLVEDISHINQNILH